MPVDASIYQNAKPIPINIPSPVDLAEKAMTLNQIGMQQMQMSRQLQAQSAIQSAYAHATDPVTGQLDQGVYLSTLGKLNPMAQQQEIPRLAAQNKATAEAQAAKADAAEKALTVVGPSFDVLNKMPEEQRAAAYPAYVQQLKSQGVDVTPIDHPYDPNLFKQYYGAWQHSKPGLEKQVAMSNMYQNPAKLNSELYGSRAPVSELASQYSKEPSTSVARSSQVAMNQMIDNYKNPSPQGDASLILNAFKIKFPTAPDVNSLEELSKSQAASDTWKNMANKALSGGLDKPTRDNLMRDGVSTFRANVDSLRDTQEKYKQIAQEQNVTSTGFAKEPSIDKTYSKAMTLAKDIGPYVPPSQRGGIMGGLNSMASKVLGVGGDQSASASPTPDYQGALKYLKTADPSSAEAFKIRSILKSKGLIK